MKKEKLIIIIIVIAVALAGLGTGGFFLVQHLVRQNSPEFSMKDAEYLIEHSPWHKMNEDGTASDKLIWTFEENGKGTITTNGGIDTYDMTWKIKGSTLIVKTAWLYNMTDEFSFTTDRDHGTFTIVDTAEDKLTTFVFSDNML